MTKIDDAWRRFWEPPEESLLQSGETGEIFIARIRLVVATILLGLAVPAYIRAPGALQERVYLAAALVALPVSILVFSLVRQATYRWWIGCLTSILDVSLVSAALAGFLLAGTPSAAVNNEILFPIYFLALAATGLRLDHRACALAALAAVVQYAAIVSVAAAWNLSGSASTGLGPFGVGTQATRLIYLITMGFVGTLVNMRVRTPHLLSAADSLTELMNRRAFEERWDSELARSRRYGRPISIAVIDIDYFKQFNDTYGHAAGDTALRSVAAVLRSRIRAQDFVARLGGEEFVVALPETPSDSAMRIAEQLRRAVAGHPIGLAGTRDPASVTVSIGVASWPDHGDEITRLLERADDRLYEAKLAGRDQVKGPAPLSMVVTGASMYPR